MVLLYDRILKHRQVEVNKSDMTWNWPFNTPFKSLKDIFVLFEEIKSYVRDMVSFTTQKYKKSLSLWKVSLISYMPKG